MKAIKRKQSVDPSSTHKDITEENQGHDPLLRHLVKQNQKHPLHITTLNQILKGISFDELHQRLTENTIELNFPLSELEIKKAWVPLACHRWKSITINALAYLSEIIISSEELYLLKIWRAKGFNCLKKLNLNFSQCNQLTEGELESILVPIIRDLGDLRELNLNLDHNPYITDRQLHRIGHLIVQNLPKLQRIYLGFSMCREVTGNGMCLLTSIISRNLINLERIFLNFGGCNKITDEHLGHFATTICQHLTSLKKLIVYLWRSNDITDAGLRELGTIFPKLVNLEKFSVNFRTSPKITSKGLDALTDEINRNLGTLNKIVLVFDECEKISTEYLQDLEDKMTKHKKQPEHQVLFTDDPVDETCFKSYFPE